MITAQLRPEVQHPPAPLDESISDCLRAVALLDGAAAMVGPGSSRMLIMEARAQIAVLRNRLEGWIAVSEEHKREIGNAAKHIAQPEGAR